jgi:hypothetical protein
MFLVFNFDTFIIKNTFTINDAIIIIINIIIISIISLINFKDSIIKFIRLKAEDL